MVILAIFVIIWYDTQAGRSLFVPKVKALEITEKLYFQDQNQSNIPKEKICWLVSSFKQ